MQYIEEFIEANDGHEIPVRVWRPKEVTHVLTIAHGMAEYCERYSAFAEWMTDYNIAVVALNHRGHGMDCEFDQLGFFAESRGWQKVIDDLDTLIHFAKKEFKGVPIILMGHSMGSFIAQCYVQQNLSTIDSLILMSTNKVDRMQIMAARVLISVLKKFQGPLGRSKLFSDLTFAPFNRHFKPNRTKFDWLSRDMAHVDAYCNDPYCGFLCTNQFWRDFLGGMASITIESWPKDIPIHLISGSDDPVGGMGRGVNNLKKAIMRNELNLASVKLYPKARHELINETNCSEIWTDLKDIVQSTSLLV